MAGASTTSTSRRTRNIVVGGSIPSKMFYAFDLDKEELAWDMKMDLGVRCMAIETNPDGSTKRVFTQLSALNGFSVVDFAARKEVTKVPLPEPPQQYDHGGYRTNEPSHGISMSPDNKTLWVTSIPNNAVYVYDVATLKNDRQGRPPQREDRRARRAGVFGAGMGHVHAGRQVPLRVELVDEVGIGGRYRQR